MCNNQLIMPHCYPLLPLSLSVMLLVVYKILWSGWVVNGPYLLEVVCACYADTHEYMHDVTAC